MASTYGLEWITEVLRLQPTWTVQPSTELISQTAYRHLKLLKDDIAHSTTEFQFQDAFNKLYAVECPRRLYLMRITLPVHPHFKTSSEVAKDRTASIAYLSSCTAHYYQQFHDR